jgi:hypothetical protein
MIKCYFPYSHQGFSGAAFVFKNDKIKSPTILSIKGFVSRGLNNQRATVYAFICFSVLDAAKILALFFLCNSYF